MFTRVRIDLLPRGEPGSYEFVIKNTGAVTARDVDLGLGLIPDGHREPIFITSGRQPFPIPSLAPGQQVAVPTMLVLAVPSSFEVELRWTDRRRHESIVTFFR